MLTLIYINLNINLRGRDFAVEEIGSKRLYKFAKDNISSIQNLIQI